MFHQMAGLSIQSPLTISVLVVHLLLMSFVGGQSQLIGSSQPIVATIGDDIILPCHLEPAEDVTSYTVEWSRPDLEPRYVHVWRVGQELIKIKNPSYSGRTSLFTDELKHGNISLKLSRLKPADEGRYTCFVPDNKKESFVELRVGAASPPVLSLAGTDKDKGGVVLQCESKGWYPEPELLWLDAEGKLLSAGPTETVRGPDVLYTVSSRVTVEKRHSNSFTCRVQQKTINQTRDTHIHVPDDFFKLQSSSSPVNTGLAVTLAVFIKITLLLVFFVWKKRQNIKTKRGQTDEEAREQKKLMTEEKMELEKQLEKQLQEEKKKREEVETLKENLEEKIREIIKKQAELLQFNEDKQRTEDEMKTKTTELVMIRNTTTWYYQGLTEEEVKKKEAEAVQEVETLEKELKTKETELQTKTKQFFKKQSELLQLILDHFQTLEKNQETSMTTLKQKQDELQPLLEEKKKLEDKHQRLKMELETKNQQLEMIRNTPTRSSINIFSTDPTEKELKKEKEEAEWEVKTLKKELKTKETELQTKIKKLSEKLPELLQLILDHCQTLEKNQETLMTTTSSMESQNQPDKDVTFWIDTFGKSVFLTNDSSEKLLLKNWTLELEFTEKNGTIKLKERLLEPGQAIPIWTNNKYQETGALVKATLLTPSAEKQAEHQRQKTELEIQIQQTEEGQGDEVQQLQDDKTEPKDEEKSSSEKQETSSMERQEEPDSNYVIMIDPFGESVGLRNDSSEKLVLKNWTLELEFTEDSGTITLEEYLLERGQTIIIWMNHKYQETGDLVKATLLNPSGEIVATCTRPSL